MVAAAWRSRHLCPRFSPFHIPPPLILLIILPTPSCPQPLPFPRNFLCPSLPPYPAPKPASCVSPPTNETTPPEWPKPLPTSGSHALPSGSHGEGAEGEELEARSAGPDDIPFLTLVNYQRTTGGGHTIAIWRALLQRVVKDRMKALKEYGHESPYFQGMLSSTLAGSVVVPFDLKQLSSCLSSCDTGSFPGLTTGLDIESSSAGLTTENLARTGHVFDDHLKIMMHPCGGEISWPKCGVTTGIPDPPQDFWAAAIEERPIQKLNWRTDEPVWVEQWPLSKQKLKVLNELVEEQLRKGNIEETTSPWNSPVFVIQKAGKTRWRLLHDLRKINKVIEDMGPLQPGMPSPTMLPQNWNLAIIDIKDCFFQIPLHPDDAPCFAFSVPTINQEAPQKSYHWRVLPQGMKNSPVICQWYVSSLLAPVRAAAHQAIIHRYMDDVLVCAPNEDLLAHVLDLTVTSLVAAGFKLQESKIQKMTPWKYLGLEIGQ
ncbi:hypothetical protein HGM15179_009705 [Zosterops borbonicus]|uniref:ribonuclease H n=1 Tax=Zosterops borbonicus TaxID=364589 RepID=A0A8K1LKQ9_9PASS|nr:hypothetical protein HGM15179_009705 [Zosterops borbonicus]